MSNTDWSGTWPSRIASWVHSLSVGAPGGEDEGDLTFTGFKSHRNHHRDGLSAVTPSHSLASPSATPLPASLENICIDFDTTKYPNIF